MIYGKVICGIPIGVDNRGRDTATSLDSIWVRVCKSSGTLSVSQCTNVGQAFSWRGGCDRRRMQERAFAFC